MPETVFEIAEEVGGEELGIEDIDCDCLLRSFPPSLPSDNEALKKARNTCITEKVAVPLDCFEGYVKDKDGKCVKKSCPRGDPLLNPEVAPQTVSGIRGGMFGLTRTDKNGNPKWHKGLDLKNPYGTPIYAIGTAKLVTQVGKAGHYVDIISTINGITVNILYFHMQQAG